MKQFLIILFSIFILISCSGKNDELFDAVEQENQDKVLMFLNKGVSISIRKKNLLGEWGVIHLAAIEGQAEIVKLLVAKGADIHAVCNDGYTAVHFAASGGHKELLTYLIDKGAKVNTTINKSPFNLLDGKTPLHAASREGHLQTVKLLINHGANIHAKTKDGATALHDAAYGGFAEIAEYLISQGADINAKLTNSINDNNTGWTPLHYSAYFRSLAVARLLIKKGANLNSRDYHGKTPFDYAHSDEMRSILK